MAATRVLIIANPAAGGVSAALVWEVVRLCRRLGSLVSVRWTTGPGEATRIARKAAESVAPTVGERAMALSSAVPTAPATLIVAVGGDGHVHEVTAGLDSAWQGAAPTRLLIVPAGTTNAHYQDRHGSTPWQSTLAEALGGSAALAA